VPFTDSRLSPATASRSARVTADTDLECRVLSANAFEELGQTQPRLKIVLLTRMALGIARLLRKTTREISVFDY
jgi:hypothetical protein